MTDDEALLTAYLDGEMSEAEAAAFEARLAAEPELMALAGDWRAVDQRITQALAPVAEAPVPEDILRRLGLAAPPAAALSPAALSPAAQPMAAPVAANDNREFRRYAIGIGGAVAASLAAVLLLIPREAAGPPHDLSFALETSRSGQTVRLADGAQITPTLTVKAADGRYCREYRAPQGLGLACRNPGGGWTVTATGAGTGPADGGSIAVAAGPSGASLDSAYRKLGASDPLDPRAEEQLLRGGWSAQP